MAAAAAGIQWNAATNEQRGKIIKWVLDGPIATRSLAAYGADWTPAVTGNIKFSNNNYPTTNNFTTFLNYLRTNLREYLDGLTRSKIALSVTDESLGKLGSANNLAVNPQQVGTFVSSIPLSSVLVGTESGDLSSGTAKEAEARRLKELAILNPDQYVKEKNNDIRNIEALSLQVFNSSFNRYHNDFKYPSDDAKKHAIQDMNAYKQLLMKQHNAKFNVSDYQKASGKIIKNA